MRAVEDAVTVRVVPQVPVLIDRAVGAQLVRVAAVDLAAELLLLELDHGDEVTEVEAQPLVGLDRDVAVGVDLDHDTSVGPVLAARVAHDRHGVADYRAEGDVPLAAADGLDVATGLEVLLRRLDEVEMGEHLRLHSELEPLLPVPPVLRQQDGDVLQAPVVAGLQLADLDVEGREGPQQHVGGRDVLLTHERQHPAEVEPLVSAPGVVLVHVVQERRELRGVLDVQRVGQQHGAAGLILGPDVVVEGAASDTGLQDARGGVLLQEGGSSPAFGNVAERQLVGVRVAVGKHRDLASRDRDGNLNRFTRHVAPPANGLVDSRNCVLSN